MEWLKFKTDFGVLNVMKKMTFLNKAVIIHNGIDDFNSQPSGAAGMRIGCMEIKIPEEVSL